MRRHVLMVLGLLAVVFATFQSAPADVVTSGACWYGPDYVADTYVIGPTTPGKWGSPVIPSTASVTWSTPDANGYATAEAGAGAIVPFTSFVSSGDWHAALVQAFASWTAVANITFSEIVDSDLAFDAAGATADIRLGGHTFDGASGILAHGYYPPNNGVTAAGDVHFDTAESWFGIGGSGSISLLTVAAHEIGHAIGLDHTSVPNSLMNPFYNASITAPQPDDIAGAVFLYGAPQQGPDVPEPSALAALLGMAAVGMMISLRRRMKRA